MMDVYGGYKHLFKPQGITEPPCLAYAQRKLFDLHAVNHHSLAQETLQRFAQLY